MIQATVSLIKIAIIALLACVVLGGLLGLCFGLTKAAFVLAASTVL